jgi:light-independent protochlorophyllide reductase subunit B
MKLTVWTYEGPPHVGAMRVATGMKGLHYVLHAPQGDTYADLLFTMIERRDHRPPVTYTTFQARDLGADTAGLFKEAAQDAYDRFRPEAIIVGASCTAELIQDDPGGLAETMGLPIPVIPLELPSYSRKENFGADETFFQIVRHLAAAPCAHGMDHRNLLGPTGLGFRHRDDVDRVTRLLAEMGIGVNVVAPDGVARPSDIARLPAAHFNVLMYPETAEAAARWLRRPTASPSPRSSPSASAHPRLHRRDPRDHRPDGHHRRPPPPPALVVGLGRLDLPHRQARLRLRRRDPCDRRRPHRARRDRVRGLRDRLLQPRIRPPLRALAKEYGLEALITDDYLEVEAAIAAAAPELILGTQMERHIGKRLGIPCAVISAPVHVQDFPARYSPQMGWEGANVIFDTWVHPLVMGLEEHLLTMFREDFEFHDAAGPSHHGGHAPRVAEEGGQPPIASGDPPGVFPARRSKRSRCRSSRPTARSSGCRCRARVEEDPLLRARQGQAQHREIRRRARRRADQRRDALRSEGPLCAMTDTSPATAS